MLGVYCCRGGANCPERARGGSPPQIAKHNHLCRTSENLNRRLFFRGHRIVRWLFVQGRNDMPAKIEPEGVNTVLDFFLMFPDEDSASEFVEMIR